MTYKVVIGVRTSRAPIGQAERRAHGGPPERPKSPGPAGPASQLPACWPPKCRPDGPSCRPRRDGTTGAPLGTGMVLVMEWGKGFECPADAACAHSGVCGLTPVGRGGRGLPRWPGSIPRVVGRGRFRRKSVATPCAEVSWGGTRIFGLFLLCFFFCTYTAGPLALARTYHFRNNIEDLEKHTVVI